MNITRENVDALNAILKVDVAKEDYSDKVNKILSDYRKTANIPGFRKGAVPMGMVKKQYGKAVVVDEVNKLIQDALSKYLTEEKLDVLGQPIPKNHLEVDWDADDFTFEFELGLTPEFDVNLKGKKAITHYKIIADEKMINDQIERVQKKYGKITSQDTVAKDSEVTGTFTSEEKEINSSVTLFLDKFKGKSTAKQFIGAKVGDVIVLKTKGLYEDEQDLMRVLNLNAEEVKDLDIEVSFTISEINKRDLAELNQELFDKLFAEGEVTSEEELKARIKEDAENQFVQQSDQKLLNDVTEYLIENTKFDLPAEFLTKWMQTASGEEMDAEKAKEQYEKSENSLRCQLIEGKIVKENEIEVSLDDLKAHARQLIKAQMAQFGQTNPSDVELEAITTRILSNEDEARRISEQLVSQKLLDVYKEKANIKVKEVTYDKFVKEVYEDK